MVKISGRAAGLLVACLALAPRAAHAQSKDSTAARIVLPPVEIHGFLDINYRSGDPLIKDGYRLRKADIRFNGLISPNIRWRIGFDAGKVIGVNTTVGTIADSDAVRGVSVNQSTRMLQDAALTWVAGKQTTIDFGQQQLPFGLEGSTPLWNIETIDRSLYQAERSREAGLGDMRDLGAMVNGRVERLEYHAGVFDEFGETMGTTDGNPQKAMIARLVYHLPVIEGLQIGTTGGFEGGAIDQKRQRFATEFQYSDAKVVVRGETMAARDGLLRRFGWYGLGAYRVQRDLQLVARYDWWDRDVTGESALSNGTQVQVIGGANYFLEQGRAKIALNIVHQTFPHVASVRNSTFALLAFAAPF